MTKPASRARLLALLAVVCGLTCTQRRSDGFLRFAHATEVYSLDPNEAADAQSRSVLCNIYEGLVEFDRELRIAPALARSWTSVDDRTWDFELRPGVGFHDGRPLTAADVKFSLERVGAGLPGGKDPISSLATVEVLAPLRIKITTAHRDPLLLNRLTQMLIVPHGFDASSPPVGTGPYRVARYDPRQLDLVAVPGHWRAPPPIARLRFLAVSDEAVVEAFGRGDVDLYRLVPAEALPRLRELPRVRVVGRQGLCITYLWFDCTPVRDGRSNPFADVRVRRAVSMALDREDIARRLGGQDLPAHQLLPPGVFGFLNDWKGLALDPGDARRLLAQAGQAGGLDVQLFHPATRPYRLLAAAAREALGAIGIRVATQELGWLPFLVARRDRRLGFFLLDWTFDDGDAWTFLRASLHTRGHPDDVRSTNPGYSNTEVDRLIAESQQAPDAIVRARLYAAAMHVALRELPIVPVRSRYDLYAVSDRVRFEPRLDGKLVGAEMQLRAE